VFSAINQTSAVHNYIFANDCAGAVSVQNFIYVNLTIITHNLLNFHSAQVAIYFPETLGDEQLLDEQAAGV
jgi:hypothetical protein